MSDELRLALQAEGRLSLQLRVQPRSARTEWAGTLADGSHKVKLAAVPEGGRANAALVRFLADELGVPESAVAIKAGAGGRLKQVQIRRAKA